MEISSNWRASVAPLARFHWPSIARAAMFVGVAIGLVVLYRDSELAHVNLALGKPVIASSQAFDTEPSGAVDGNRYGQLGFHSEKEASPWLRIDLGRATSIDRITVFGRADCCFDQSLPLVVEVSNDGLKYRPVAERNEPFTQYEPWRFVPEKSLVARFLRLRTTRLTYLVVSEVEVRGVVLEPTTGT